MRFANAINAVKEKFKKEIKTKRQLVSLILILLAIVTTLTAGIVTLARYVSKKTSDGLVTPSKFYFESNLLAVEAESYRVGTDTITFDLKNFDDNLRVSEVDIDYTVTIQCTDKSVVIPEGKNTSGTLSKGTKSSVSVEYGGLTLGKTYTVYAKATAPYTKILTANFTLPNESEAVTFTKSSEGGNDIVVYVTAKTGNVPKEVILKWQNGYVPDNSVKGMADAGGNSHLLTLEENSVYTFRFFKSSLGIGYNSVSFGIESVENIPVSSLDHYGSAEHITTNGITYKRPGGSDLTDHYSVSGYISITATDPLNNAHIQFKVSTIARFLLWDSDRNGIYGIGHINDRSGYDGTNDTVSETPSTNPTYPNLYDSKEGTITLKWQVIVTDNIAYWFIDNRLVDTMDNIFPQGMTEKNKFFNIGVQRADIEIYGMEIVARADDEAGYNAIISVLGIPQ